ncbi:hypothetical protein D3C71_2139780 [compost metagenome]
MAQFTNPARLFSMLRGFSPWAMAIRPSMTISRSRVVCAITPLSLADTGRNSRLAEAMP